MWTSEQGSKNAVTMASSSNVRGVIELFCKIFCGNSIVVNNRSSELGLRAETLRQAKFNNGAAVIPMWQLLYNVVCYCNGKSIDNSIHFHLTDAKILFIKREVQKWGYLDQSVSQLSKESEACSRLLLLVLGWVIHRHNVFDLIILRRKSPLQEGLVGFIKAEFEDNVEHPRCEKHVFKSSSAKDQLQHQVLLSGKLRQSLKRLYASQQLCANLRDKITKSTRGVNLQPELDYLTPLEVYLIKNKYGMKKMLAKLETDSEQLQNLLDWKEKESIFWEWMDSVLCLHIEESASKEFDLHDDEEVFLPVPTTIGQDIFNTRAQLRDLILYHEDSMDQMERLLSSKKIPKLERQLVHNILDQELSQLNRSLLRCGVDTGSTKGDTLSKQHDDDSLMEPPSKDISERLKSKRGVGEAGRIQQCQIASKVKVKMEALQKRVNDLKMELNLLQAQSLQKLQCHLNQDSSVICIQPTTLKHFFKR